MKLHAGKSGDLAQSAMPLYFGLGDADSVSEVRVAWPSGVTQTVSGPIAAGQRISVKEPEA